MHTDVWPFRGLRAAAGERSEPALPCGTGWDDWTGPPPGINACLKCLPPSLLPSFLAPKLRLFTAPADKSLNHKFSTAVCSVIGSNYLLFTVMGMFRRQALTSESLERSGHSRAQRNQHLPSHGNPPNAEASRSQMDSFLSDDSGLPARESGQPCLWTMT